MPFGAIACFVAGASAVLAMAARARPSEEIAVIGPSLAIRVRTSIEARQKDARAARCALPLLQSVHAALRSGLPLSLALRVSIADLDPGARTAFAGALREFDLGARLDQALRAAARAAHGRRVALVLAALSLVADEQLSSSRSAAVIASVADRLAFEDRVVDEVRARTSGMRAQIVLLALVVPALALYLAVTLPGLAATLSSPLGSHVLVPAALIFELTGVIASRAIVRGLAL